MSFGTETAGLEGAVGATSEVGASEAILPGLAAGSTGAEAGGTGGFMAALKQLLSDPETSKALGDAVKHFGNMTGSVQKMSPESQKMIRNLVQKGGSTGHRGMDNLESLGGKGTSPFMGDAASWVSPHVAQDVLKRLGIPFGGS